MPTKRAPERQQISVWVMADDLKRADRLVAPMERHPTVASVGQVTRSTVLRLALTRGLDALEAEYKT